MYISKNPDKEVFKFGERVTLNAIAMGFHAISYRWLKNDVDLSTARHEDCDGFHTPDLTISTFTPEKEGQYQCSVSSEGGTVLKSSSIKLKFGK